MAGLAHYAAAAMFLGALVGAPALIAMEFRAARHKIAAALAYRPGPLS